MVVIDITIPDELTKEERNLVEKLAEQPNFKRASGIESQNIFERMKNFFR
jgi:DnaJ-class molecular chaperone